MIGIYLASGLCLLVLAFGVYLDHQQTKKTDKLIKDYQENYKKHLEEIDRIWNK